MDANAHFCASGVPKSRSALKMFVPIIPRCVTCLECLQVALAILEGWERTETAAVSGALHLGQAFAKEAASHNSNSLATEDLPWPTGCLSVRQVFCLWL